MYEDPNKRNLVAEVSTKDVVVYGKGQTPKIVAYDCGMKYNIIRYLVETHKVELTVVPFNYDLEANSNSIEWQGLFLSNGPGDPTMCSETIESIKYALALEQPRPIFGICLGNQLLALAAGAKTYKLRYGNRGMNQPCVDLRTGRCYITPQNHGFAVDSKSLPDGVEETHVSLFDGTNCGLRVAGKPVFSVQHHPEASPGPQDSHYLFRRFIDLIAETKKENA